MRKIMKLTAMMLSAAMLLPGAVCAEEETTETSVEACTGEVKVSYPLTLEIGDDNELYLESEPERIVSMGPNMTELLYAIGAGDRLVGRTDYCDFPEEVLDIPSVGSISDADIEAILDLEPDLVLASVHFSEDDISKLEEAEIPVLYLNDAYDFTGVFDMIYIMGEALNCSEGAEKVVDEMNIRLDYVSDKLEDAEKISAYYVVGYGEYGDYTATGDTFINGILEAAGAENIAGEDTGWTYSSETLLEKDPEYVIIPAYADGDFQTMEPYSQLTAVKEDRVIVVDNNMFDRQGPRNADAVLALAAALHPEVFPEGISLADLGLEEEAEEGTEAETAEEESSAAAE